MAMKSITFHAAMRDKYPVYGCLVEIQQLTYQIQLAEEELQAVLQQLAFYRQQAAAAHHQELPPTNDYLSSLQLGTVPPRNSHAPILHQESVNININPPPLQTCNNASVQAALAVVPQSNNYNSNNADYNNNVGSYGLDATKENNVVDSFWMQQSYSNYSNNNNNTNSMAVQSQLTSSQPLSVQQEANQDYNEMQTFFDNIDDRQSFIGSKDAYESSLDSSLKDSRQAVEQMAENELKSAAACFTLTSVNYNRQNI